MKEKELESLFRELVMKAGGYSIKLVSPGLAGVPDRLVIWPRAGMHFIELKTRAGRLSAVQKNCHELLSDYGCHIEVLYGIVEVEAYVTKWKRVNESLKRK